MKNISYTTGATNVVSTHSVAEDVRYAAVENGVITSQLTAVKIA